MKNGLESTSWLRSGLLIFAAFTLLTLLNLPNFFLDERNTFLRSLAQTSLTHYLWALLTPLIFLAGGRYAVEQPRVVRNLSLHFLLGLVFTTAHTLLLSLLWDFFSGNRLFISVTRDRFSFLNLATKGFMFYAAILAVGQAIYYSRRFRDREFRLQQAELQTLKTQLHPHFLFNTLNAISALVYNSPKTADRTVTQLSDLLRKSLQGGKNQEVRLEEELDFLKSYLQIHQTLMEDRLEVRLKIAPETLDAAVPNMLLQPLIENSIRHGLSPLGRGGYIEIESRRQNGDLALTVRDNGRGLPPGSAAADPASDSGGGGVGLSNTRARLRYLYRNAHDFKFAETPGGGLTVDVKIPFRRRTPPPPRPPGGGGRAAEIKDENPNPNR